MRCVAFEMLTSRKLNSMLFEYTNKNSKLRSFRIKPLRSRLLLTAEEKQRHNIIFLRFERFEVGSHRRFHFFIFSKIGMTCSKVGLLPGSSFMQILISLAMWLDMPGEISTRRPSVEIWNEEIFCWIQKSIATGSFTGAKPHLELPDGPELSPIMPK